MGRPYPVRNCSSLQSARIYKPVHWILEKHRLLLVPVVSVLVAAAFQKKVGNPVINALVLTGIIFLVEAFVASGYSPEVTRWSRYISGTENSAKLAVLETKDATRSAIHMPVKKRNGELTFFFQKVAYVLRNDAFELDYPLSLPFVEYLNHQGHNTVTSAAAFKKWGENKIFTKTPSMHSLLMLFLFEPFIVIEILLMGLMEVEIQYYTKVNITWYKRIDLWVNLFVAILLIVGQFQKAILKSAQHKAHQKRMEKDLNIKYTLFRDGKWRSGVEAIDILPMDIIHIESPTDPASDEGNELQCDVLLLSGEVKVSEALVTGEDKAVVKQAIDNSDTVLDCSPDSQHIKRHVLRGGCKVISVKPDEVNPFNLPEALQHGTVAYVLKTGFATTKGTLFAGTLDPIPRKSSFWTQLPQLLMFSCLNLTTLGYEIYSYYFDKYEYDVPFAAFLARLLSLVLHSFPTIILLMYDRQMDSHVANLAKKKIVCIDGGRLIDAGNLTICCFDKTGTLTENKMQLAGLALQDAKLSENYETNRKSALVMACCQALFEENNVVYGDAMEQAMVEALDSIELLEQQVVYNSEVMEKKIIVPFSSEEKHMTVVATSVDKGWSTALVKGQPGKVKQYLNKVPSNYDSLNNELSAAGLRVWALCYKDLKDDDYSREAIEAGMTFAGFLCFRNQLKPDTNKTLNSLRESGHVIKVITGDQQLTALHVAKEINLMEEQLVRILHVCDDDKLRCLTLEEYKDTKGSYKGYTGISAVFNMFSRHKVPARELIAMMDGFDVAASGEAVQRLKTHYSAKSFFKICKRIKLFAAVLPAEKKSILESFRLNDQPCMMCGDGLNDILALSNATVGVSLAIKEDLDIPKPPATETPTYLYSPERKEIKPNPLPPTSNQEVGQPVRPRVSRRDRLRMPKLDFQPLRLAVDKVNAKSKAAVEGLQKWATDTQRYSIKMWYEMLKLRPNDIVNWLYSIGLEIITVVRSLWQVVERTVLKLIEIGFTEFYNEILKDMERAAEIISNSMAKEKSSLDTVTTVVNSAHFTSGHTKIAGVVDIVKTGRVLVATLVFNYNSFLLTGLRGQCVFFLFGFSNSRLMYFTSGWQIFLLQGILTGSLFKIYTIKQKLEGPAPAPFMSWTNQRMVWTQVLVHAVSLVSLKVLMSSIPEADIPVIDKETELVDPSIPNTIYFLGTLVLWFNVTYATIPIINMDVKDVLEILLKAVVSFAILWSSGLLRLHWLGLRYSVPLASILIWDTYASWSFAREYHMYHLEKFKRRLEQAQ